MGSLANKRIVLGVTGGIAAYKSADLVRRLQDAGATVRVVMTPAATEFITPLTLQALSGYPVHLDLLDTEAEAAMGHIELGRWADAILVAPASADFIARVSHGEAGDLLTATVLASSAPLAVAPAMNQGMWAKPGTRDNIATLRARGVHVFGPGSGSQACGDIGPGRMLEPLELAGALAGLFRTGSLDGHTVVVTAGPTREAIDPVRYISNHSSGKMGYALAEAAAEAGARTWLVSGPTALPVPDRVERIDVTSAQQMLDAVMSLIEPCTLFIGAAAVADYRPKVMVEDKIKKAESMMTLELERNPDIIAAVAAHPRRPVTVGFAAETRDVVAYAADKRIRKGLDAIIANDVSRSDIGFDSDDNQVFLIDGQGARELPLLSKTRLARTLIDELAALLKQ